VQGLAPLVELTDLNLLSTQVSGAAKGLAPLVRLRRLFLKGTQVKGNFKALEQQLPKLQGFLPP